MNGHKSVFENGVAMPEADVNRVFNRCLRLKEEDIVNARNCELATLLQDEKRRKYSAIIQRALGRLNLIYNDMVRKIEMMSQVPLIAGMLLRLDEDDSGRGKPVFRMSRHKVKGCRAGSQVIATAKAKAKHSQGK